MADADPTYNEAIYCARLLIEPGENPEYERGMCELIGDLWATPEVELGVRAEEVHRDMLAVDIMRPGAPDDGVISMTPQTLTVDITRLDQRTKRLDFNNLTVSEALKELAVLAARGCTGALTSLQNGTITVHHDGESCPVHEP